MELNWNNVDIRDPTSNVLKPDFIESVCQTFPMGHDGPKEHQFCDFVVFGGQSSGYE
jgi:hypothetical protein